jgi:hypothetical protein
MAASLAHNRHIGILAFAKLDDLVALGIARLRD